MRPVKEEEKKMKKEEKHMAVSARLMGGPQTHAEAMVCAQAEAHSTEQSPSSVPDRQTDRTRLTEWK